jgi:MATE family multidrug resistance protein
VTSSTIALTEEAEVEKRPGTLLGELGPTLRLAGPVVLAELGWMAMGVVDLVMVGALGAESIAAVGLGNIAYFAVAVAGIGMLLGMDALASQAFGAGKVAECHRWLVQACWLAVGVAVPVVAVNLAMIPWLTRWGIAPEVATLAAGYLRTLSWGTVPLFLYFALRRYLQAMNLVGAAMATLLGANLLNAGLNWVLIHGKLGLPAMGVVGSGWSTVIGRFAMFAALAFYAVWHSRRHGTGLGATSWRVDWPSQKRLAGLGWPGAIQLLLEVGVFAIAAVLAGRLGPAELAAHEVVLNAASVTFMVPLGLAQAGGVRVGQAIGRKDPSGAARAGWAAMLLGGGFMACAGAAFLLTPRPILEVFTRERDVIRVALPLLAAAAAFQLFDGLQVVAGGALRGTGDTRTPLFANLAAHWTIGLPVGYVLAFPMRMGLIGLWIGLAVGLICVGVFLVGSWAWTVARWRLHRSGVGMLDKDVGGVGGNL